MLMKKVQIVIPLVLLLIVGSTAITPALAAKEKGEKIEYTVAGTIWDSDKGTYGAMSLSLSGKTTGPPDYRYEDSGSGPQEYIYDGYWEEEWEDESGSWRADVYIHYEIRWDGSYSVYEATWYSPQPKFNGKIVVIWQDGSTETFRADLSPAVIYRSSRESTGSGELSSEFKRVIYLWDKDDNEWQHYTDEIITESSTWTYTGSESVLSIDFSGKIQTRGRPPLEGFLNLYDYTQVADGNGNEYRWTSVSGEFGPYSLGTGYIVPVPPPAR